MFNIIGLIIVGVISGALARFFYPGVVHMSLIMTAVLAFAAHSSVALLAACSRGTEIL